MNERPAGFTAKASADAQFKMSDDGAGTVEGYFAVFGNKDSAGEVIEPGAFKKHLPEFLKRGFLADHHDWKKRVGYPVEAKEDDRGLYVKFAFHSDPAAQAVRTRLREREAAGLDNGLSIGYSVPKGGSEQTKEAKRLKEIRLFEGSPVAVPCNEEARAASVKAVDGWDCKGVFEDVLAERQPSLYDLWSALMTAIGRIQRLAAAADGTETEVDARAMLVEAFAEFTERAITAALDGGSSYGYMSAPEGADEKAGLPAGLTFDAETSTVLAAGEAFAAWSEGYLDRANRLLIEKRVKEGRQISTLNRKRLDALREHLATASGHCDELLAAASPREKEAPSEPSVAALRAASLRLQSKAAVLATGAPS